MKSQRELLETSYISDINKQIILQYIDFLKSKGSGPMTINNNLASLRFVANLIQKDFGEITESDIVSFVSELDRYEHVEGKGKQGKLSESTKYSRKSALRAILNFIGKKELAKVVKMKACRNERPPDSILTDDDFESMLAVTKNVKDVAILYVLYESGARLGEMLTCTVNCLVFGANRKTANLTVTGKTGTRTIQLSASVPYIKRWLKAHPNRNDSGFGSKPLWTLNCRSKEGIYKPMTSMALRKMLLRAAKKAGIEKPVNPHSFRHARATRLANNFNNEQLKKYMGWAKNSNMAHTYCHLTDKDIAEALMRIESPIEEEQESCLSCNMYRIMGTKFCGECGMKF